MTTTFGPASTMLWLFLCVMNSRPLMTTARGTDGGDSVAIDIDTDNRRNNGDKLVLTIDWLVQQESV